MKRFCVSVHVALDPMDSIFALQLSLNEVNRIDVAFDGADEVDSQMNLIKVYLSSSPAQNGMFSA